MSRYVVVLVLAFFGIFGRAAAVCTPGEERVCFVNGEEGTEVCQANGQFGGCNVPSQPPPTPTPTPTPPPTPTPTPPPGLGVVAAQPSVFGIVASTGNLYWTQNLNADPAVGTPGVSRVFRAGKNNVSGNETILYAEQHPPGTEVVFWDIVFAHAGGFFGYFTAEYRSNGGTVTQMKRVPLEGGAAVVLATLPAPVGARGLSTNGTMLFWSDNSGSLRRMPINGGPITTLVAGDLITRSVLDGNGNIIFSADRGLAIRKVSTFGGNAVTLRNTSTTITALYATPTQVFWGELGGAVRSTPNGTPGPQVTYQNPMGSRAVTSVGFDGSRVLWTDCAFPANNFCVVRKREPGATLGTVIQNTGTAGASRLQWDSSSMYWRDTNRIWRFRH